MQGPSVGYIGDGSMATKGTRGDDERVSGHLQHVRQLPKTITDIY